MKNGKKEKIKTCAVKSPQTDERKPGVWEDKITIKKDFDILPTDFIASFIFHHENE